MRNLISILTLGILITSCQSNKINTQDQTLILKMTIDSTLTQDPGINTDNYWIDFSNVDYFSRLAIKDFIRLQTNFTEIDSDSLFKNDSTWIKYGFLQNMLIKFKNVELKGDSIIIEFDKIKATDGSNGIQTVLKKVDNHYKVVGSKITWIS